MQINNNFGSSNKTKVLFICPLPPPYGGQAIISEITKNIVKPDYFIDISNDGKISSNIYILFKILYYLIFKKNDLIYFTCSRSKLGALRDILLLFVARIKRVKVINHLHGNEIEDILHPRLFKKIIVWSYSIIDTTIFVSNKQADEFPIVIPSMKKIVIPNCYDTIFDSLNVEQKEIILKKNEINILFISFLMESKGVLIALDTFEKIAYKYPNVKFNVAGEFKTDYLKTDIEIKRDFYKKWDQLIMRFPNRFFFHGVVTGEDKRDLFLLNDILFFPTFFKTESFGLVIVEAMRAGNVIVASDFNNISEIVTKDIGRLFKSKDIESAFNEVDYLLQNNLEMRNIQIRNMKISSDNFSQSKYSSTILDLFTNILQ